MKKTDQIIKFIEERIGHIYFRPRMYGGDASGTDMLLHYYHELWAEIFDRRKDYENIRRNLEQKQDCGSASFSIRYKENNPGYSDDKITDYVVEQWKKISKQLGIQIPYEKLSKLFKN